MVTVWGNWYMIQIMYILRTIFDFIRQLLKRNNKGGFVVFNVYQIQSIIWRWILIQCFIVKIIISISWTQSLKSRIIQADAPFAIRRYIINWIVYFFDIFFCFNINYSCTIRIFWHIIKHHPFSILRIPSQSTTLLPTPRICFCQFCKFKFFQIVIANFALCITVCMCFHWQSMTQKQFAFWIHVP